MNVPTFNFNCELWTIGSCCTHAGTRKPIVYYLPLICEIFEIHQHINFNNNRPYFTYKVRRPKRFKSKISPVNKYIKLTYLYNNGNVEENTLAFCKEDMLKLANKINKDVRMHK